MHDIIGPVSIAPPTFGESLWICVVVVTGMLGILLVCHWIGLGVRRILRRTSCLEK